MIKFFSSLVIFISIICNFAYSVCPNTANLSSIMNGNVNKFKLGGSFGTNETWIIKYDSFTSSTWGVNNVNPTDLNDIPNIELIEVSWNRFTNKTKCQYIVRKPNNWSPHLSLVRYKYRYFSPAYNRYSSSKLNRNSNEVWVQIDNIYWSFKLMSVSLL